MPEYEVKEGDVIRKIAQQHGLLRWETIWDDDSNSDLRDKRENPDVLHPKDLLHIPEKETK